MPDSTSHKAVPLHFHAEGQAVFCAHTDGVKRVMKVEFRLLCRGSEI